MRGLQIILTIIAIIYFVWTIPTKADPKEVNVDLKTDIAELCSKFTSDIKNLTTISRPLKTNSIIIYHGNCLKLLPRKSLLKKSRIPHTHLSERSSETASECNRNPLPVSTKPFLNCQLPDFSDLHQFFFALARRQVIATQMLKNGYVPYYSNNFKRIGYAH